MENTARNFVLQLGSLIALYVSLSAIIMILFGVINVRFPDAIEGYWAVESAKEAIRFGTALLFVFFPTYIVLTRFVNKIRRVEKGTYLTLTKWLVYLSLLIGGGILLGDLVAVILTYLSGEITTRFVLKAAVLLFVIGVAFTYYILDARGYWNNHEARSIQFAGGASVFAIIVMIVGFVHLGSPQDARDMRLDQTQVTDLQTIQSYIEQYYRVNTSLPETIDDAFTGSQAPTAPEGRPAYEYVKTNDTKFELCAVFAKDSFPSDARFSAPMQFDGALIVNGYIWDHKAGRVCFERAINPNSPELIKSR